MIMWHLCQNLWGIKGQVGRGNGRTTGTEGYFNPAVSAGTSPRCLDKAFEEGTSRPVSGRDTVAALSLEGQVLSQEHKRRLSGRSVGLTCTTTRTVTHTGMPRRYGRVARRGSFYTPYTQL